MARRRGFFAELEYQNQLAKKRQLQAERAAAREYAAAVRAAEQTQRRAERAAAHAARAAVAEQKEAEREAKRLHVEAREAEVASLNSRLNEVRDEIEVLLLATLLVDDHVDLERHRSVAEHPPFAHANLETPVPPPALVEAPPEPMFTEPEPPKGLSGIFGKKKHAAAVAQAQDEFARGHEQWKAEAAQVPARQLAQMQDHDAKEQKRLAALGEARDQYQAECEARDAEVASSNAALDELIAGLAAGSGPALQEYVGIVLSNSIYPESFPVEHDFEFDAVLRELVLTAIVPHPSTLPTEKVFRYVKAKDEIASTAASKKNLKDLYASAVHQVALRRIHEVFEADRAGHIKTIALTVAADGTDPATGVQRRSRLVGVGADRESFVAFDLSNIVPEATLTHLGAAISKSPFDLVDIDGASGVRGR